MQTNRTLSAFLKESILPKHKAVTKLLPQSKQESDFNVKAPFRDHEDYCFSLTTD